MSNVFIFDTETTGFNEPEIVEMAYLEIHGTPAEMLVNSMREARFQPSKPIELGALATHHILDFELEGYPKSDTFEPPFADSYVIGHNVDFDVNLIKSAGIKRICTLALSRYLFPEVDSHSQSAMLYLLKGRSVATRAVLRGAHSAMQDVLNCLDVLQGLMKVKPVPTWEELYQLSELARIPTVMTFGKYKGVKIVDVPLDYISWYLRQADRDPYLEKAFSARIKK